MLMTGEMKDKSQMKTKNGIVQRKERRNKTPVAINDQGQREK